MEDYSNLALAFSKQGVLLRKDSKSPSDRFNLPFGTAQYGESLKKLEAAAGAAGAQGKIPDVNEVLKAILEKGPTGAEGAGPAESTAKAPAAPQAFGISNVKHFGFNGPFAMEVGLAKDGTAAKSDVTAEIGFSGGDWKLTKLVAGP